MSLFAPTYLVSTVLCTGDTKQLVLSVLVVEPDTTEEQLDRFEASIAACLHNGSATDFYDTPAFERIDGVIAYPDSTKRKVINTVAEVQLLSNLPRYTDITLDDLGEDTKREVDNFIALCEGNS